MGGSRPSRALIIVGSLILVGVVSALLYLAFAEAADAVRIPMTTWVPKSDNASLIHGVYQFIFILAGAVFVVLSTFTGLVYPWIVRQILDDAIGAGQLQKLNQLMLLMVGILLLEAIATVGRDYCFGQGADRVGVRLRTLVFGTLLR